MGWAFAIGIPVALFGLFVIVKVRKYKAIYAPTHFIELARSLQRTKNAACRKINEPLTTPPTDDERLIVSSARIASMYTVDQADDMFIHYFSISIAGGYTPHAVGGMFTVYFTNLLGIPHDKLQLGISENNVYHCRYQLTSNEHANVEDLQIAIPTEDMATEAHHQYMAELDELQWPRIQVD